MLYEMAKKYDEWEGEDYVGSSARGAIKGCVRELIRMANESGFYWGGHFNRLDGVHFEVAQV